MQLYSTSNKNKYVSLKKAVLKSLAPDKGLYMPDEIPVLPEAFFKKLPELSFQEIAFEITSHLFGGYIADIEIRGIIERAINFPAPVVMLDDKIGSLELWHGPSLAFKDFGARFMANLMSYLTKGDNQTLDILVATSGDTGGAVAFGFLDVPGIKVTILYPKGKVSLLQEKQLTTLGSNITALEVDGNFDDCQAMVKEAFLDQDLNKVINLSSANSINIARLIPQSFYYFEAYKQLLPYGKEIVFSVPSGNFGNLTAGLIAKKMGLPVSKFIAATNINKIVPDYLKSGVYEPKTSIPTISNAMDVGAPSNFVRMMDLYDHDVEKIRKDIVGYFYTDDENREEVKNIYNKHGYVADPHGALGYKALAEYLGENPNSVGAFFETAHPSKFVDIVEELLPIDVEIPERLALLSNREKQAIPMSTNFEDFKKYLLAR